MQTVRFLPLFMHNTDQSIKISWEKISLETLNELVEMTKSKHMNFFGFRQ